MARINIYPLRYTASKKVLEFASEFAVTITWTIGPKDLSKKETTKGFEKLISNITLNNAAYMIIEQPDLSAQAAGAGTGSVRYITGAELRGITISCDYLIITHQNFFSTTELAGFANYRVNYSGLNVVVAKTEDIYAQFPNGSGNDYSIKDFMQYAYSNWQTAPQYLLIIGDVEYVPTHPVLHEGPYMDYEEWYVCVSGGDEWPDMAMGRFSIKSKDDIASIKNKIAAYEQDPVLPGDYHTKGLYVEGSAGHNQRVIDILFNAGFEISELYAMRDNTWQDFISAVDSGRNIVYYYGHGGFTGWEYGGWYNDISLLSNNNYPVILTLSCDTASLSCDVSIGEHFVNISGKGAVAYYGATTLTYDSAADIALIKILDSYEYVLGKAVLLAEISHSLDRGKENILLGDPALQTFGYKLNRSLPDLTLSSSGVDYDYPARQLTLSVANIGGMDAVNVLTRAYIVDYATGYEYPFGEYSFPLIPAGGSAETTLEIQPPFNGGISYHSQSRPGE